MTYEETVELEENVKLKNEANDIYKNFLNNVRLGVNKYKIDGKFIHWQDTHNTTYFIAKGDHFEFVCDFLHENYTVVVTPEGIFNSLKKKSRGVDHLRVQVTNSMYV